MGLLSDVVLDQAKKYVKTTAVSLAADPLTNACDMMVNKLNESIEKDKQKYLNKIENTHHLFITITGKKLS